MICPKCGAVMRTQRIACEEHGSHLWWICLCGVTIPRGMEE